MSKANGAVNSGLALKMGRLQKHAPFAMILLVVLLIGLVTADDYGETFDDQGLRDYGHHIVRLYKEFSWSEMPSDPGPANLRYYGPAFVLVGALLENSMRTVFPQYSVLGLWHLAIFFSFLVGLVSIYVLALRLFEPQVSAAVALLVAAQPLLWGHGFINAKDIPLFSFFALSIAIGLRMEILPIQNAVRTPHFSDWKAVLLEEWATCSATTRRRGFVLVLILFSMLLFFFATGKNWLDWLTQALAGVQNQPNTVLGRTLLDVAPGIQAQNLIDYALKAHVWGIRLYWIVVLAFALLTFGMFSSQTFPRSLRNVAGTLRSYFLPRREVWTAPVLWLAGAVLGFTTAIRIIAPLAGVLVLMFLWGRHRWGILKLILPYAGISMLVTYVLWPYLWAAPIANFLKSLQVMADFPWLGQVYFNGRNYLATELPRTYLPTLLAIQLTVPVLILIVIGGFLAFRRVAHEQRVFVTTLILWSAIPSGYVVIFRPAIYDNFRQFLFALPPLFILAGFALAWLRKDFPRLVYRTTLGLILLSAIMPVFKLHPYEYVYYNQIVGGLPGAEGRFELDYWATAFTHAAIELDRLAPPNSRIVVWGPHQIVENAIGADKVVEANRGNTYNLDSGYNYAVINVRTFRSAIPYEDSPVVVVIQRDGVPLAIVKKLDCTCDSAGTP